MLYVNDSSIVIRAGRKSRPRRDPFVARSSFLQLARARDRRHWPSQERRRIHLGLRGRGAPVQAEADDRVRVRCNMSDELLRA